MTHFQSRGVLFGVSDHVISLIGEAFRTTDGKIHPGISYLSEASLAEYLPYLCST